MRACVWVIMMTCRTLLPASLINGQRAGLQIQRTPRRRHAAHTQWHTWPAHQHCGTIRLCPHTGDELSGAESSDADDAYIGAGNLPPSESESESGSESDSESGQYLSRGADAAASGSSDGSGAGSEGEEEGPPSPPPSAAESIHGSRLRGAAGDRGAAAAASSTLAGEGNSSGVNAEALSQQLQGLDV